MLTRVYFARLALALAERMPSSGPDALKVLDAIEDNVGRKLVCKRRPFAIVSDPVPIKLVGRTIE